MVQFLTLNELRMSHRIDTLRHLSANTIFEIWFHTEH